MPDHAADARLLLTESPDNYVAERARLVKQARAAGDRASAGFYQALKRPNLSLWAVLSAGDDASAVNGLVSATTELAEIQGGGAGASALSAATQHRRNALEALVDRGVKALAKSVAGAASRRAEIRDIIDQLSRHPNIAETWIDGTLRELPDDTFGFAAFTGSIDSATTVKDAEVKPRARRAAKASKPRSDDTAAKRSADLATDRAARAERAQVARKARQDVVAASHQLATVERRVIAAQAAVREAEDALRLAEEERAAAEQRNHEATARLEANRNE